MYESEVALFVKDLKQGCNVILSVDFWKDLSPEQRALFRVVDPSKGLHSDVKLNKLRFQVKLADPEVTQAHEWRCFHCGQVFTNPRDAADHFGHRGSTTPAACQRMLDAFADEFEHYGVNRNFHNVASVKLLVQLLARRWGIALCGECGGSGRIVNDGPYSKCDDCNGTGIEDGKTNKEDQV